MKKKIGEGRTAEIFAIDDHHIAKVFRSHIPDYFIDHELKISERIQELDVGVPKVYGKKEIDGKTAIIYERIDGQSLLAVLISKPWKVKRLAKTMAEIHHEFHLKKGDGLDSFKVRLADNINQVKELTQDEKEKICDYLNSLPAEENQLCHGDYHPDNILFSEKGAVVIDWTTAVSGDPLADVARTAIILQYAALPDEIPSFIKTLFRVIRPALFKSYLRTYINISGMRLEEMSRWELPLMAARLLEGIQQEEKETLLLQIRKRMA